MRSGLNSERGTTLVEAALVTPIFLLFVFGILEFGLLFLNNLTTTNASREGARAASVYGRSAETDYLILRTVADAIDAQGVDKIDYVVVFKVNSPGDPMDPSCHLSSQSDVCNRYTASDFTLELDDALGNPTGYFRCGPSAIDRFWCPGSRSTSIASADLVGVYVKTTHTYITGFFRQSQELDDATVIRIEPSRSS